MTATLDLAPWTDRILDDGTDRERWLAARADCVIGASDAAGYVKPESEDKYVAAKLKPSSFHGNSYTEAGHEWEPRLLAAVGIPQSSALIHSPTERGFAATPDGIVSTPEGIILGEAKIKHNKIVRGPTPREFRQVAWQIYCVGWEQVLYSEFVWGELVNGELRNNALEPKHLRIYPRDVEHLIEPMLAIATPVLARLRAARQFAKEIEL
ncbi:MULTISPECIES: hypothetical protein [unclassified Cryobacterium]|uniref:hypothetical protein n=1 Tax=unclassified Cryobacterium TaxID=2649013 RepID=UPI001069F345|nr:MULTISPECIES: hypothetical protein [unclassified Cryobacterium]TFC59452.1 hypothetical protein E3O68_00705 [Cryobacterium sp. TMB3-1-2]TFC67248.1 hypothetical protein E3T21_17400 [Cryobacterium sp. TMB3-15]TFC73239.1 hypothetical protein E3T22_16655 [Cryobacterium sp. TMB3-10]TFD46127.1 hypothetical protein E3T58_01290 [Cryobacterium sp. TMB3-12]